MERAKLMGDIYPRFYLCDRHTRIDWEYRLIRVDDFNESAIDSGIMVILDSGFNAPEVTNETMIESALEHKPQFVIPKDYPGEQEETTQSVRDFLELWRGSEARKYSRVLIPLQPPYDEHYREFSDWSFFCLGGLAKAGGDAQVAGIQAFREEAGYKPYAHGLGMGSSPQVLSLLRDKPRMLDSFDNSTACQRPIGGEINSLDVSDDGKFKRINAGRPKGTDSSTVTAKYMGAEALKFLYLLNPGCETNLDLSSANQHSLAEVSQEAKK